MYKLTFNWVSMFENNCSNRTICGRIYWTSTKNTEDGSKHDALTWVYIDWWRRSTSLNFDFEIPISWLKFRVVDKTVFCVPEYKNMFSFGHELLVGFFFFYCLYCEWFFLLQLFFVFLYELLLLIFFFSNIVDCFLWLSKDLV